MSLSKTAKDVIRWPLRTLGYDVVKLPRAEPSAVEREDHRWLNSLDIRTVLDIGANTGQFAKLIRGKLPEAMIYSFEPLAGLYRELLSETAGMPRFQAFNYALGEERTEVEMHRNAYSPSSSILQMTNLHWEAFPFTATDAAVEKVQVRRLDDVAEEVVLEDAVLIKIDVQGYELFVLRGGPETVKRARALIVETSFTKLYEGQPLFDDIYKTLKKSGFDYGGNWDQLTDPRDGRILQTDAIFLRC